MFSARVINHGNTNMLSICDAELLGKTLNNDNFTLKISEEYYAQKVVEKEENEMLKFKNFGRKSLTELQEKLGELDLHFGMDIKQYLETE